MEERNCPKCMAPVAADEKFCHNCGFEISSPQAPAKSGQTVSARVLWLAAVLIIAGLVMVGTLIGYVAVSSFNAENWGALFTATPEPGPAASASSKAAQSESASLRAEPETLPLTELPSTADNDYIVLRKALNAQRSGDKIQFVCAMQNASDVVCTGVGVEVDLYDAAENFVSSSSSWVYRDVQPGEVFALSFAAGNGQNIRSYCLTKIGGKPVEAQLSPEPEAPEQPVAAGDKPAEEAGEEEAVPALSEADFSLSYGLTLLDGVVEKTQENYFARLQGRIRNDSGIKYNAVYINFVIYDAEDNQISTTITATKDLEPGVIWKFSAPLLVPLEQATKYKISSVSVY